MPVHTESVGMTDVGSQRSHNEDAHVADDGHGFWVVCDGMGGHASGAVASQVAIDAITRSLSSKRAGNGVEPLVAAILDANASVLKRARSDVTCRGMGTTVVGLRLDGDVVHACHVGDSRIYLLRDGKLKQLTRDHSLINLYADNPQLVGRLGPAHSNVIVRAVGLRDNLEVDHQTVPLSAGDVFLLCCDGLTDMVDDWLIQEILNRAGMGLLELPVAARTLIDSANANGGADNITVVLVQVQSA
ncbi:MAG: serine/threonine-protein phosphatase [Deltaproteobacteria bacterium]|nr:serine/threonine-protein phosphatase [Deltaproteobacteria bacterium]